MVAINIKELSLKFTSGTIRSDKSQAQWVIQKSMLSLSDVNHQSLIMYMIFFKNILDENNFDKVTFYCSGKCVVLVISLHLT